MKIRWIVFIALITIFALNGCSSTETTDTPDATGEVNLPIVQQENDPINPTLAYPAPIFPALAYPPPSVEVNPDALYPGFEDGTEVTWEQAKAMILNGEVRMVKVQGEPTNVTLGLIDGRLFYAVATDQLVVINVIRGCGLICQNIIFYQE